MNCGNGRNASYLVLIVTMGGLVGCSSGTSQSGDSPTAGPTSPSPRLFPTTIAAHRLVSIAPDGISAGTPSYSTIGRSSQGGLKVQVAEFNFPLSDRQAAVGIGRAPLEANKPHTSFGGTELLNLTSETKIADFDMRTYSTSGNIDVQSLQVMTAQYGQIGLYVRGGPVSRELHLGAFYGATDTTNVNNAPPASARYTGVAGGAVVSTAGTGSFTGELDLHADIGNGVVRGEIANIQQRFGNGAQSAAPYKIKLNTGGISGSNYTGRAEVVSVANGATVVDTSGADGRSDYRGSFFGPNGEEAAGMVDITGTGADPQTGQSGRLDLIGGFLGKR